jgi:nonribosomal peptide synthetase DhbF
MRLRGSSAVESVKVKDSGLGRDATNLNQDPANEFHDLSASQLSLWTAQILEPCAYNTSQYTEIDGLVDWTIFLSASRQVVREFDALRLRFAGPDYDPKQWIDRFEDWYPARLDFSNQAEPAVSALAWMDSQLTIPFDLSTGPSFQWVLIRLAERRFIWFFQVHHLILDGFGRNLVARRLAEVYSALSEDAPPPQRETGSCLDLLVADLDYRRSVQFGKDRQYWLDALTDRPVRLTLSNRIPGNSRKFVRESAALPASVAISLMTLAKAQMMSLAQILVAAIAIYKHRLTTATDLIIGMPVTARSSSMERRIPASVSNVLPVRVKFGPHPKLADILNEVSRYFRSALRHQRYRYEELRSELHALPGDADFFSISTNALLFDFPERFGGSAAITRILSNGPVSDLSISIYGLPDGRDLQINIYGNCELYQSEEVVGHLRRLQILLADIANSPMDKPIAALSILDAAELKFVLGDEIDSGSERDAPSVLTLIERQVALTPHATALEAEDCALTYAELDARSNRIARQLVARNIGPDDIVAVLLDRSHIIVSALLGVLKSGAAYLPLDPSYPSARLAFMLMDSGANALITTTNLFENLMGPSLRGVPPALFLDQPQVESALSELSSCALPNSDRNQPLESHHLAYVIYTSGSTGDPKGVAVQHRALATFLAAIGEIVPISASDKWLAMTSIGFDIAALELFLPLTKGATVILLSTGQSRDPAEIASSAIKYAATILQATPSLWQVLVDQQFGQTLRVLTGGEPLSRELARKLSHIGPITNLYGPTEATVWTSAYRLKDEDMLVTSPPVPIGRPLRYYRTYVLNADLVPVPIGISGELYIAGPGLARGYLGNPSLTEERFIACPFGPSGSRMYRTGDLARWRFDRELEFLGRVDRQVKVRGFRVEFEEIEAKLSALPAVAQAVVVPRTSPSGASLVAYLVERDGQRLPHDIALRSKLSDELPDYMVPSLFVRLAEMPMTSNGKLDYQALPEPEIVEVNDFVAPTEPDEILLCRLFGDLTGAKHVGINSDFFQIGGHSLLAAKLAYHLRTFERRRLPLQAIFRHPTPKALAKFLTGGIEVVSSRNSAQRRPVVFLFPGIGGDGRYLDRFRAQCSKEIEIITIDYLDWKSDGCAYTLEALRDHTIAQMAKVPFHEPLRLVGHSWGAKVAYAATLALLEQRKHVDFLGLFDGASPSLVTSSHQPKPIPKQRGPLSRLWRFTAMSPEQRALNLAVFSSSKIMASAQRKHLLRALSSIPRFGSLGEFDFRLDEIVQVKLRAQAMAQWATRALPKQIPRSVPIVLFRSDERECQSSEDLGWRSVSAHLRVIAVSGDHIGMFGDDHVAEFCAKFFRELLIAGALERSPYAVEITRKRESRFDRPNFA